MSSVEIDLHVPQGRFHLSRPGATSRNRLRAWDAADEYVLHNLSPSGQRVLILNDGFGALAVALASQDTTSVTDSFVSRRAAAVNLEANHRVVELGSPIEPVVGPIDIVLIKVPKTLSLLEHQLHTIRPGCHRETVVLGAGMVKHVHSSTLGLFERIIGPTTTSLAKKKARLIHARFDIDLTPGPSPWPRIVELVGGHKVMAHAGVFAGTKLDIGTNTLLANLPALDECSRGRIDVVDLGCGNGIVGSAIAKNAQSHLTFVDESYYAVASARATFGLNHPERTAEFLVDDCGQSLPDAAFDLVLNNPPFHTSHERTDAIAWKMFLESRRILRPGGELRIVGNRHLGYHAKLKRLFGNCQTIASTPRFVVLSARL
jgi:16S rRNA (guanine1207-N2)-methyltransferase